MLLAHFLRRFVTAGTLRVIDADGAEHVFAGRTPGPDVTIRLHSQAVARRLLLHPELHLGEAYTDGELTVERGTLRDLLELAACNYDNMTKLRWRRPLTAVGRVLRYVHQFNPVGRARRNAAHHYDLSDRLYELFLDRNRQYSTAYFRSATDSLDTAQENKMRRLAAKLLLRPGQKVLDIGSGWGGLGMFLANSEDVEVTGLTLSAEQQRYAAAQAKAAGLAGRASFHLRDYRQETGRYDRIVSVGMFEHVGVAHYGTFFRKLSDLLADDGVAVLHSIGRMEPPGAGNPWIRKYIFPGGYTPALSEVIAAIEKSGLWVTDIEVLRLHYANTLREWHRRFRKNWDEVRAIYDERFCRMWEFYLVGCEMAFRYMGQMVFQVQIAKRQNAVPLTRDYIGDYERTGSGQDQQDMVA